MIYFDTNVLVHSLVNQNEANMNLAQTRIEYAIKTNQFIISPLVVQELVFVLSKLKCDQLYISKSCQHFLPFVIGEINTNIIKQATEIACEYNLGKSINDVTHLVLAQMHAKKLVTFDSDFLVMQQFSSIPIEWLR
jgi:predicted nucleic acid-binding protein